MRISFTPPRTKLSLLRLDDYYQTYRVIGAYLAFLDQVAGAPATPDRISYSLPELSSIMELARLRRSCLTMELTIRIAAREEKKNCSKICSGELRWFGKSIAKRCWLPRRDCTNPLNISMRTYLRSRKQRTNSWFQRSSSSPRWRC